MDKSIIDACTWWLTWNKQCFRRYGIDKAMCCCYTRKYSSVRVWKKGEKERERVREKEDEFKHFTLTLSSVLFLSIENNWRWRLIRTMTIETCPPEWSKDGHTSIFWTNNYSVSFVAFLTWSSTYMTLVNTMWCALVYNVSEAYRQICTVFFFSSSSSSFYSLDIWCDEERDREKRASIYLHKRVISIGERQQR